MWHHIECASIGVFYQTPVFYGRSMKYVIHDLVSITGMTYADS